MDLHIGPKAHINGAFRYPTPRSQLPPYPLCHHYSHQISAPETLTPFPGSTPKAQQRPPTTADHAPASPEPLIQRPSRPPRAQPGRDFRLGVLGKCLGNRDQILRRLDPQQGTLGKERLQFFPRDRSRFAKQFGIEGARFLRHGFHRLENRRNDTAAFPTDKPGFK